MPNKYIYIILGTIVSLVLYTIGVYSYAVDVTSDKKQLEFDGKLKDYNELALKRDNELLKLNSELQRLRDENLNEQTRIRKEYSDATAKQKSEYESVIASLNDDNIRLRIKLRSIPKSSETTGVKPTPTGGEGNVEEGSYLPKDTARYLVGRAALADEITLQLTTCQVRLKNVYDIVDQYKGKLAEYKF